MSTFDQASLVMIPSGYKTSKVYSVKPTDGSGDLTFSRSNDTATRVNSAGLIEKVRTNLILQSQTLTTTWTTYQAVITSNATTAPDGTTTAEKIQQDTGTLNSVAVQQVTVPLGELTLSAYLKAGTTNLGKLGLNTTNWLEAIYDLSNGTIVSLSSGASATIVAAGNGWYRCTLTREGTNTTSYVNVGCTPQVGEYCYAWGCQLEAGVATDYIPTTTAAVSVGPVANVPRLDYLNSSCPRLLLEPQRQNVITFSEQMDNAAWTKNNTSVTPNGATSPDGYANADFLVENTANGLHEAYQILSVTSGVAYTLSTYAKADSRTKIALVLAGAAFIGSGGVGLAIFDLSAGSVVSVINGSTATITAAGNGWYRCTITKTSTDTGAVPVISLVDSSNNTSYTGNGIGKVALYGCQLEAGAYATSYIPTLGAAVTRGAETAIKTSATALIGQTEGTIFLEFQKNAGVDAANIAFSLSDGTSANIIYYNFEGPVIEFIASSSVQAIKSGGINLVAGTNKIAVYYKANDFGIYLNGTSIFTDTSGSVGAMSKFNLGSFFNDAYPVGTPINQAILFKTRLTNAQLAELTTL